MSVTINNLIADEQTVISNLNIFNNIYSIYVRCNGNVSIDGNKIYPKLNMNTDNTDYCIANNSTNINVQSVKSAHDAVISSIKKFNLDLSIFNNQNGGDSTYTTYLNNYNTLLKEYADLMNLRSNLDLKLKEIYSQEGTVQGEFKTNYDSTVYASIMWSVLATSLIYYVFVKL